MNEAQRLWWNQARSDHALFVRLRREGVHDCHLLHYLQMATEKLSKAYLWRSGHAPPKTHTGFVRFLKALLDRRTDLERIATTLGFRRREDLDTWVRSVRTLAYALQNIAPAEAGDGPNPEYPWPHDAPIHCPIDHTFALWTEITNTGRGRKLIEFVERAIARFESYA
jgi:HEPN domain-containing protein